jgi:beta-aspartyl-peptidase (threonine type)
MMPALERRYRSAIERALKTGHRKLAQGRSSLDAVEAAVRVLEDSPLFNAGKGAVFTHDGRIELDAAIMDGDSHQAGAVTGLTCAKNPISAARAVMERSPHVLMMGEGANQFIREVATAAHLRLVEPSYFWTQRRWDILQEYLRKEEASRTPKGGTEFSTPGKSDRKFGTVGAVAVDDEGNLASATSTGGITGKKFGRTGDTPIVGAGTFADNATCAVSCTGHGEYFMRNVTGHDVSARMKYKGLTVKQAASEAIEALGESGGKGGLIAIDSRGQFATPFNTPGMFRGFITLDGAIRVDIYRD